MASRDFLQGDVLTTKYQVDLGDGFKAVYVNLTLTEEPIRHRYESPGVYRVSVRAENAAGHDEAVLFVQVNCKSVAPVRPRARGRGAGRQAHVHAPGGVCGGGWVVMRGDVPKLTEKPPLPRPVPDVPSPRLFLPPAAPLQALHLEVVPVVGVNQEVNLTAVLLPLNPNLTVFYWWTGRSLQVCGPGWGGGRGAAGGWAGGHRV